MEFKVIGRMFFSKFNFFLSLIFFLFFSNSLNSQNFDEILWTELGPFNIWAKQGRINCIAVNPDNENIIYAGTPTGGVWKSEDKGKNWFPTSDLFVNDGVSAIAINPVNTEIIYIGTGDKSGQVYGKEGSGIYKSTDGGKTWLNINNKTNFTKVYEILINPENSEIIYANSSIGFYKSINSGKVWKKIHKSTFKDIVFKPDNPQIIYAISDNEFIKFYNNADNLETYDLDIDNGSERRLTISDENPNIIYLMVQNKGFYKSSTNEISFEKVSDCDYKDFFTLSSYCYCLAADNQKIDIIYFGTKTLWRSLDGGKNWENKKSTHNDNHYLGFSKSGILYCGNDGGICYTTDSANTWHGINKNLSISQIYDLSQSKDGNLIITGTQDNGANICTLNPFDDTPSWKNIIMADVMRCDIDNTDRNYIYFTNYSPGGTSKFRRSIDCGESNSIIGSPGKNGIDKDEYFTSRLVFALDKFDSEIMYLGVRDFYKCSCIRADENNIKWTKVSDFEGSYTISCFEQSELNSDNAYLVRGLSFFYYTENLSDSEIDWTKINPPDEDINSQIVAIKIHPANDEIIYIIQNNTLWKSIDKGKNWINYSENVLDETLTCIKIDNQQEEDLYLGTSNGIFYKNIELYDWLKINNNLPPVWITDIEIVYPNILELSSIDFFITGKIRVATYGRGVWETELLKQTSKETIEIKSLKNSNNQNKIAFNENKFNQFNFEYSKSYNLFFNESNPEKINYLENNFEDSLELEKLKYTFEITDTLGIIQLNFFQKNKKNISVFNTFGVPVFYEINFDKKQIIDFNLFENGIYYLNVNQDNNNTVYKIEKK